ncbi:MAG TPA: hypothetical protein DER02_06855 [Gammaproteobacteria bacterium]|nr:hypothetical protein [Gammaproteobacteria bacterium]
MHTPMRNLACWQCGSDLSELPIPLSRHDQCPQCFNDLHTCRACRHFDATKVTECFEDRADPPVEKENANFCDFFAPKVDAYQPRNTSKSDAAKAKLDALFGASEAGAQAAGNEVSDANARLEKAAEQTAERASQDSKNSESQPAKAEQAKQILQDLFQS